MRRIILSPMACSPVQYFSIVPRKRHDFRNKGFEHKMCFDFLYSFFFSETFLILRRIQRDTTINVDFHIKYPLLLSDFIETRSIFGRY